MEKGLNTFDKRHSAMMKGVAICMMLTHHLFYSKSDTRNCTFFIPSSEDGLIQFATFCKVCVAMYLLLSAYGLYKSYTAYTEKNGCSFKNAVRYVLLHIKGVLVQYWWCVVPFAIHGMVSGVRTFQSVYGTGASAIGKLLIDIVGFGGRVDMYSMYNITCWYLALAFALYALFPILYYLLNRDALLFGGICLFFSFSPFPRLLLTDKFWLLPFCFGMVLAKYNIFDRVMERVNSAFTCVGILIFLAASVFIRNLYPLNTDALAAFAIMLLFLMLTSKVGWLGKALAFLGRHSANIFMTHTLFYSYFWHHFFYAPKYPLLIFLLLLCVCVVYSILLEGVKKLTGMGLRRLTRRDPHHSN